MSLFLRQIQHLLPDALAWRLLPPGKILSKLFGGLAGLGEDARDFADGVHGDLFPETTRELASWETQFGLDVATGNDAERRARVAAAWQATGGQSPSYLQTIVQAAGFPLFVHEWWKPVDPFQQVQCGDALAQCGEPLALCTATGFTSFVRDPRAYTDQPHIGTFQCSALTDAPRCTPTDPAFAHQPQCNAFLANEPGYLVNETLTDVAPPPIPDDPATWPFFVYVGGQTFPDRVEIPATRRAELERLLLKLRPTQLWIVMLVDYV